MELIYFNYSVHMQLLAKQLISLNRIYGTLLFYIYSVHIQVLAKQSTSLK